MSINFDDIDNLIEKAINQIIRENFSLDSARHEKSAQDQLAAAIADRGIKAPPEKKQTSDEKDKEEDEEIEEVEEEEIKIKSGGEVKVTDYNKATVKKERELPETLKAKSIAKTLNVLRSGKSLKDKEVFARFQIYFDALSGAEKIALKGFLDGISQVIVGDETGMKAQDPSEPPYNVRMEAEPDQEREEVVKTSIKQKVLAPSKDEDTPIVVGESADKSAIFNFLRNLS
tara:strand:- start:169 stop:858 length:690 start_codon:yes stop_codon:yes gene_type:complete